MSCARRTCCVEGRRCGSVNTTRSFNNSSRAITIYAINLPGDVTLGGAYDGGGTPPVVVVVVEMNII